MPLLHAARAAGEGEGVQGLAVPLFRAAGQGGREGRVLDLCCRSP
jgi:hypothetical protein